MLDATHSSRHERVVLDRCPGTCLRAPAAEVACLGGLCGAGGGCAAEVSGSQSKVRWADSNGEPTWQWSSAPFLGGEHQECLGAGERRTGSWPAP